MNWSLILTSMLPEHLLLLGMLAILGLEIKSGRSRDGFGLAVLFVAAAAVAAFWLYATGFQGAPFLHHFSVGPSAALPKAVLLALAYLAGTGGLAAAAKLALVPAAIAALAAGGVTVNAVAPGWIATGSQTAGEAAEN
jgi:hypothetical protein